MRLQDKWKELETNSAALLAVNFYNLETGKGIARAAAEAGMPVIFQATEGSINYMGPKVTATLARTLSEEYELESWLHLDHAESYELVKICLEAGFDSVMIDASEKPFDENIKLTRKVVELASKFDANVEAELGYVAKLGQSLEKTGFTEPDEARIFVEKTGVDALAVAIGSAHGFYTREPKLDLERLHEIHMATDAALVLHGGSGIPVKQLQESIRRGIRKINLATEIKNTFMKTLQRVLQDNREIDLRKVFPPAIDAVKSVVKNKLEIVRNSNES